MFITKRRQYRPEFKLEAIKLTRQPGVSCRQIALEISINPQSVEPLGRRSRSAERQGILMHHHQDRTMVMRAVEMAVWQKQGTEPSILHSDRGSQFTSGDYQRQLKRKALVSSMSAVGHCADNAACEGFFGVLKRERVNRHSYRTQDEARADIFDYIERFHNPRMRRRLATQDKQFNSF